MEIRKRKVNVLAAEEEAVSQITLDEDFNVPDNRADVGRIILKTGALKLDETRAQEGKALVRGSLVFHILYVADAPGSPVLGLEGMLPVAEAIYIDGLTEGSRIRLTWETEDLNVRLLNSRKLNIRAIITLTADSAGAQEIELPVGAVGEGEVAEKKGKLSLLELMAYRQETLRVGGEAQLLAGKPNIREVIWKEAGVRGLETRAETGRVLVQGEIAVFVLYEGENAADDEPAVRWQEAQIPFQSEVNCPESNPELIPHILTDVRDVWVEIRPDADGEERVLWAEALIGMDVRLFRESEYEILKDCYTPSRECVPTRVRQPIGRLLMRNNARFSIRERISAAGREGDVLQICHCEGQVVVDRISQTEGSVRVEGVVRARVLYCVMDDEMPFYAAETGMAFSRVLEAPGADTSCSVRMQADLMQIGATMPDGGEIEIRADVSLDALITGGQEEELLREVSEEEPDREKMEAMPGVICYCVQDGDTLWDIARRFYTTVGEAAKWNALENGEVKAGDKLLLIKNTEEE